jgi:uncharacterized integral membrane protein
MNIVFCSYANSANFFENAIIDKIFLIIMKTLTNLIVAILIAFWISVVAVFSIQNITQVSLNFLVWQSIKLPIGVLLSFSLGGGFLIGALVPLLWQQPKSRKRRLVQEPEGAEEFDFDFDEP